MTEAWYDKNHTCKCCQKEKSVFDFYLVTVCNVQKPMANCIECFKDQMKKKRTIGMSGQKDTWNRYRILENAKCLKILD